jgi:hypothetical protein
MSGLPVDQALKALEAGCKDPSEGYKIDYTGNPSAPH